MEPILDGEDYGFMLEAQTESSGAVDSLVRIKRQTGWTGGTLDGVAQTPTYQLIDIMGTIESVTMQEIFNSGGMLSVGDVKATLPFDLREVREGNPDTGAAKQESDVLLYEGYNWYMVGRVERWRGAGGLLYSRAMWRRS
ncbi:MAG: hypothetical protein KGL39_33870 [Patescibacteria group bacterium]|nr:hypothetical protein [Patescibacteria group bacterium]